MRNRLCRFITILVLASAIESSAQSVYSPLNDLWSYDPDMDSWDELSATTTSLSHPGIRKYQTLCYDSLRDRTYMFGGTHPPGNYLDDGWSFDMSTGTWSQLFADSPSGRLVNMASHSAAVFYDPALDKVVIPQFGCPISLYAPATNTFSQIPNSTWTPTTGLYSSFAYDEQRQKIYCFGGSKYGTLRDALNMYDFATSLTLGWQTVTTHGDIPAPRWLTEIAVDSQNHKLLLFGGNLAPTMTTYNEYANDTFSLDLDSMVWTRLSPSRSPYRCGQMGMCYDSFRQQFVAFAGLTRVALVTDSDFSCFNDIWTYDSSNAWTMGWPLGPRPTIRRLPAVSVDTLRHKILIFGGEEIAPRATARAEVLFPQAGTSVSGDKVMVQATRVYGNETSMSQVLFQYRAPSETGSWTDIITTSTEHPNPATNSPYYVHWDTSSLIGEVELRAMAIDSNGTSDALSPSIEVAVNHSNAENTGITGESSYVAMTDRINDAAAGDSESAANMLFRIPRGALASNTNLKTKFSNFSGAGWSGFAPTARSSSGGRLLQLVAQNEQTNLLGTQPMTILCPFADHYQDGKLDGTNVQLNSMKLYRIDGGGGAVPLPTTVDEESCIARGTSISLGNFILMAPPPPSSVSSWQLYNDFD